MTWTPDAPLVLDAFDDESPPHQLSDEEVRFLQTVLEERLDRTPPVELERDVGGTRIHSRGAAGAIALPSGRQIRLEAAFGTRNLVYLWAYARDLDARSVGRLAVHADPGDTLVDAFGRLFESELESLLRGGLRPRYREQRTVTSRPGGRIDLQRQLRRPPPRTDVACTERTLTHDTPLNRGLCRATSILVRVLPAGELRSRLESHRRTLREYVDSTDVSAADLDAVTLSRLETEYARLLPMTRHILRGGFLGDVTAGSATRACAMIVQLWRLHERVVERAFRAAVRHASLRMETQVALTGFLSGGRFEMRPDIVIYDGDEPVAVVDAKWKSLGNKPQNAQLYQLAAYQKALEVPGLLIYPEQSIRHVEYEVDDQFPLYAGTLPVGSSAGTYEAFVDELEAAAAEELARCL